MHGWRPKFRRGCKSDDKLLEEHNSEIVTTSETLEKIDTCDGGCEVWKSGSGVSKSGNKWQARVRHPKLMFDVYLGRYSSPEEAALAVKKKKGEFQEMFKGDSCMNPKTCRGDFNGRRFPPGVRRNGFKKWGARIYHRELKRNISLGSYNSPEEATIAVDNKRVEFLKMYGWGPKVKHGCNVATTSEILDEVTDDLAAKREKADENSVNRCPTDKFNIGVCVADVPYEREYNPNSGERNMISQEKEQKSGCVSEFDKAMSLGIINEYGQLLGIYSELDEQMEFSLPEDDPTDIGTISYEN